LNKKAQTTEVGYEQRVRHQAVAAQSDAEQFRKFSGGLNVGDSEQALLALEQTLGPQRWQTVQAAAQQVWDHVDTLRQRMVDSGVWSKQLADDLQQQYPHYVPTKILDYMQGEGYQGTATGRSLSVNDQGLKRASIAGTDRARQDPLASMVTMTYDMERLARRNATFNAFLKVRQADPQLAAVVQEMPSARLSDLRG
jgi:hypothetical protein